LPVHLQSNGKIIQNTWFFYQYYSCRSKMARTRHFGFFSGSVVKNVFRNKAMPPFLTPDKLGKVGKNMRFSPPKKHVPDIQKGTAVYQTLFRKVRTFTNCA
jgi:hypothetical protein